MEIEYNSPIHNYNYRQIAVNFIENYANSSQIGFLFVSSYYDANALVSIHIHRGADHLLYEMIGPEQTKTQFNAIGINTIKYYNLTHTSQPLGKKSVFVTFHGNIDINGIQYKVISTFNLKLIHGVPKIFNHVLEIFF